MKRLPPTLVTSAIPALLAALAACGNQASPALPELRAPLAAPVTAPATQELVGVITTRRSAVVAAEFEARVARILVTSGQRVHTGDPLVQLDDSQLRQRVEAARHAEDAAHAKMLSQGALVANTKRRLSIEQRLYARGAQAREAVTTARYELSSNGAAAAAARAEYQAASASRVELEQQLAKAILVAPMDGVVTVIKVKEGEIARSGTKIARVFDPQDLRVQFELPRTLRGELAIGSSVDVLVDNAVLPAPVVEISADLEPPLQFAIATADLVDDGRSAIARVGAEVRVRLAVSAQPVATAPVTVAAPVAASAPVAVAASAPVTASAPVAASAPVTAPVAASVPVAASASAPVTASAAAAASAPVTASVPVAAPAAPSPAAPY
ncbi:MAG: HlyD family efflux transporter periplasmic adaptor subunit [Kofleriaceae bacterium]